MARYIDADKAYEVARTEHKDFARSMADLTSLREVLEDTPTADVVEVVRCCECYNYELMKSNNQHFCSEFGGYVSENDYCSRCKRKPQKEV